MDIFSVVGLVVDSHCLGVEQRLSYMCYWVLEFDADQEEYGLRLPGYTLEPGHGERHKEAALKALALYGLEGSQ